MSSAMKMSCCIHGISPLRDYHSYSFEMLFNIWGCGRRWEARMVNQQRFVLQRGVWDEPMGRNLMAGDFEGGESRETKASHQNPSF